MTRKTTMQLEQNDRIHHGGWLCKVVGVQRECRDYISLTLEPVDSDWTGGTIQDSFYQHKVWEIII